MSYKFGIIGCGFIAGIHALAIDSIENTEIYGAYDPYEKAADAFCEKWGAKKFKSEEELLSDESIDIVCICTPSGMHAKTAIAAMKSGKNVVVEKPMAITPEDCQKLVDTQVETGKSCVVISQLRFSETSKKVKKAIAENKLGKLVECGVHMKYFRSEEYYASSNWRGTWAMDGGGALMNQGIHGVDLMLYYMGDVKSVFAFCKTLRHDIEVEDTAVAVVEFENGAIGTIEGTTSVTPGYPRQFEICGTEGSIVLEEDAIVNWDIGDEKEEKKEALVSSHADPKQISFSGHKAQILNLINHLENGEKLLIDANEGRRSVELICAIYESSKTGKKINF